SVSGNAEAERGRELSEEDSEEVRASSARCACVVSTTQGGLTRSMEYDAAGRVISLTNENGSHSVFSYDALDRLVQQGGFDGRTQRYHYDLTG
ncbi:hypothetical protein QU857_27295, partial [Escherichia coli]|nr:hypothetical protein [Escherichia coli]